MLPIVRKRSYVPAYFDNFLGSDLVNSFFSDGADYTVPAVNIKENEKNFEIEVAAPGLDKKDFNITLDNDVLTVAFEKKNESEEKDDNFMRREFKFSSFERSFSLPDLVNRDEIKASHKNGILTIALPKNEEANVNKNKKIKISLIQKFLPRRAGIC